MKAVTLNPANSAGTRTGSGDRELRILWGGVLLIFLIFLLLPILKLFLQSFETEQGIGLGNYADVISQRGFLTAFGNSLLVSSVSALLTTALAFLLAYTIHYTNVGRRYKKILSTAAVVPMLLPTITYGFAIIYSFGKQGLLTQLFGTQLFDIYGFNGLLLGYMIYTFPISFLLISDAMNYTDKKFLIVSRVMGDSPLRTFTGTVIRPLLGTLASSFVQCFFLSFTDYGIPASLSGRYEVIATVLYNEMLGSIPDFAQGAVVAVLMLGPSVLSILFLSYLERYNIRYNQTSVVENRKCPLRDILCGGLSDIADDGGKILAVRIDSPAALLHISPLQLILILHDRRHSFLGNIRGHRSGHISPVTVGGQAETDSRYLELLLRSVAVYRDPVLFLFRLRIGGLDVIAAAAAHIFHELVGRSQLLAGFQIANLSLAINICF